MTITQSPLLMLGLALLGNLISGVVGYAVGRLTARIELDAKLASIRRGPTRTIEVHEGPEAPF